MADEPAHSAQLPPLTEHARTVTGTAHNGRTCRVVDNTGEVPEAELNALLERLIDERRFGLSGLSSAGSAVVRIGEPVFTHIQIGESLYRLIVASYEARIEAF
jgi:hypothetical protein